MCGMMRFATTCPLTTLCITRQILCARSFCCYWQLRCLLDKFRIGGVFHNHCELAVDGWTDIVATFAVQHYIICLSFFVIWVSPVFLYCWNAGQIVDSITEWKLPLNSLYPSLWCNFLYAMIFASKKYSIENSRSTFFDF